MHLSCRFDFLRLLAIMRFQLAKNKNVVNFNKNYGKCNFYSPIETINKSQFKMSAIKPHVFVAVDDWTMDIAMKIPAYCPHVKVLCFATGCYVTFKAYTHNIQSRRTQMDARAKATNNHR